VLIFWPRLNALLLGRLRLSAADAMLEYMRLAQEVFSETKPQGLDGISKASKLEMAIKDAVRRSKGGRPPTAKMYDPDDCDDNCKV
jgi:hypothetical protein